MNTERKLTPHVHHIGAAQYPVIAGVYGIIEPDISKSTNEPQEARQA